MTFFTSIAKKSTFVLIVALFSAMAVSALTPVTGQNSVTIVPEPIGNVVYQSIVVTITAKSVILDWNTASEVSNGYFEVERSANMKDFKTIALVLDGFSTEGTGKKYAFKEDVSVAKNGRVAYYRLKQFDEFGNVSYSDIVRVP
jgi:hypothetical protein